MFMNHSTVDSNLHLWIVVDRFEDGSYLVTDLTAMKSKYMKEEEARKFFGETKTYHEIMKAA